MSTSQVADPAIAGSTAAMTAAEVAARIEIPRRLPPRTHDGQPLRHLSHSSYTRWVVCRESWRRHYLCGQRSAPTGSMFLGRQVDEAITLYYQRILEHGDRLTADQVKDAFWDGWKAAAEAEHEQLGIAWEADLSEERAFKLGLDAIDLSFRELIPRLGEPVAAQRKVEFRIHPEAEWSILSFLDVETVQRTAAEETPVVVDYKVKTTPLSQYKADRDFQPDVYLAGRWLEAKAAVFQFAQIAKPGPKRREMSASIITTSRTVGQLRGALARIAQAASEIVACWETLGPDRPWGFADPSRCWKCSRATASTGAAAPVAPGCSEASSRPPGTYPPELTTRKEPAIPNPFPARYRAAMRLAGGACPVEAGLLGRLADHECAHGRLPGDRTPKCGCWRQETATVITLRTSAPIETAAAERRAA